jgi:hypothetical protein
MTEWFDTEKIKQIYTSSSTKKVLKKDARVFLKIDLRSAYNLMIRILGQLETTLMPFGLKIAPAIFKSMIYDIFSGVCLC